MESCEVPEPRKGMCVPIDPKRGEWRCRCDSDPEFDKSVNPYYVLRCNGCCTDRPQRLSDFRMPWYVRLRDWILVSKSHFQIRNYVRKDN